MSMPLTVDQSRYEVTEVRRAFHDGMSMLASADRPMSSITWLVSRLA
mgnify:CR=1 FL=1